LPDVAVEAAEAEDFTEAACARAAFTAGAECVPLNFGAARYMPGAFRVDAVIAEAFDRAIP
jgi:hypothetical protein